MDNSCNEFFLGGEFVLRGRAGCEKERWRGLCELQCAKGAVLERIGLFYIRGFALFSSALQSFTTFETCLLRGLFRIRVLKTAVMFLWIKCLCAAIQPKRDASCSIWKAEHITSTVYFTVKSSFVRNFYTCSEHEEGDLPLF